MKRLLIIITAALTLGACARGPSLGEQMADAAIAACAGRPDEYQCRLSVAQQQINLYNSLRGNPVTVYHRY